MSAELTDPFAQEQVFPTDLPPKYYLEYFNYVLAFVRKRYAHILHESELEFLDNYESLSEDAQCLFIRFSNRSKSFFRTNSLSYSEIEDMPAVLTELLERDFIETLCEAHESRFGEVIDLFTKPELLEVTKLLEPDVMPSKSIKKPDLVRWLLHEYDFGVLCEVLGEMEPVVKVSFEAEVMLMKFLFFGNRYADMTEFVVRDLGHVRFQSFDEQYLSIQFDTRKDADDTLMVSLMKETFDVIKQDLPPEEIYDWFMNWQAASGTGLSHKALPSFNSFILKVSAWLERKKMLSQALTIYQLTNDAPARERRVRLLYNLGEIDEALALCEEISESPQNADERFFSLDFYEKIKNKKARTVKRTTQALKAAEAIEVPISYRFRVEFGAIAYYQEQGYNAFFSENEPWRALFGLLFWDIIYDTNVQTIHNPLQRIPSDFFLPDFYFKRSEQLKERLAAAHSREIIDELVTQTFTDKYGITNVLVPWYDGALEKVLTLTSLLSPEKIHKIMLEMALNLRENTRGFPDLLVWNDDDYAFIEIKSPTDHLSSRQLHWQHFFAEHGVQSRIVRVNWIKEDISLI
ncbi:tetratricopeptide (TPR) repeat protein [Dyadobacter sp. BE34]|uniref:phosphodiesterase I n=1 Tax=Dyadobacter fermentans TaxID=94254 RepID=A0ABU1R2H7_9BACT|nr:MULTISPECIES: VRR-NUC domain-containing protein [Dyadobacter]MDR6807129.1 tetratricopeptide (TPR) repeat protein [Dyadobacter fermentans]MDR7044870.1 tetratricopeptide (TPR) repeat protein [Dyadobacter sp. BE242]MDR7199394.1 tetratricopeptide (TPR) repeat protein [Dyadobacter sp. BE34]MDR7217354.1 tetratricopeptide (TPR) repeat protein [Dyadobacter sp. BE31]MDR7265286.1 tetratricopeptide (TPR) repeat protein [Dyadobacter sp. BE32]